VDERGPLDAVLWNAGEGSGAAQKKKKGKREEMAEKQ
jgi:hypothetical protein